MQIDALLCLLNDRLKVANVNYAGGQYYGIAYPVSRTWEGKQQVFPTVIQGEEPKFIAIDDAYPITVYHRILGKTFTQGQFDDQIANVQMSLVVFGVQKRLKQFAEEVESQLISIFPDSFTQEEIQPFEGILGVRFRLSSTVFDPMVLFQREYRGVEYPVSSEFVYFAINYNIEIRFKKGCLDNCDPVHVPRTLCDFIESATVVNINNCLSESQREELESIICESEGSGTCIYDVYVNSVFYQQVTLVNCDDLTINIT